MASENQLLSSRATFDEVQEQLAKQTGKVIPAEFADILGFNRLKWGLTERPWSGTKVMDLRFAGFSQSDELLPTNAEGLIDLQKILPGQKPERVNLAGMLDESNRIIYVGYEAEYQNPGGYRAQTARVAVGAATEYPKLIKRTGPLGMNLTFPSERAVAPLREVVTERMIQMCFGQIDSPYDPRDRGIVVDFEWQSVEAYKAAMGDEGKITSRFGFYLNPQVTVLEVGRNTSRPEYVEGRSFGRAPSWNVLIPTRLSRIPTS